MISPNEESEDIHLLSTWRGLSIGLDDGLGRSSRLNEARPPSLEQGPRDIAGYEN